MGETENKAERILSLYTRLQAGETIDKQKESVAFQVSTRTIQRDLNDIQCFLENQQTYGAAVRQVIYDRASGGYRMIAGEQDCLEAKEILAICKVLLKEFILKTNASTPSRYNFMLGNNERVFGAVLCFNENEPEVDSVFDALEVIEDKDLIPFGIDPFGNYICYSLKEKKIVFWNHETGRTESTEKSLEDFVESLY